MPATARRLTGARAGYAWTLAAQLAGRVGNTAANLCSLALAARVLAQEQFGIFVLVTGVAVMLAQLADFGTGPVFGQHVGAMDIRAGGGAVRISGRYMGSFLLVRLALAVAATLIGVALAFTFSPAAMFPMIIASLSVGLVASRVLDPLYQIAHKPFRSTATHLAGAVSAVTAAALAALLRPTLDAFLLGSIAANAIYVGASWLAVRDLIDGRLEADFSVMRDMAGMAGPLGLSGLMTAVNGRANLLFLAHFQGAEALAVYGAATRVLDLGVNLAVVVLWPLIPIFSREAVAGHDALAQQLRRTLNLILLLTLPVLAASPVLTPMVIRALYGARYADAALILSVLAVVGFGVVVNLLTSYALLSLRVTRYAIWITGASLVVNLGLNAALVPHGGAMGAALAALGTEAALVLLVTLAVLRHIPGALDFRRMGPMFAASALVWLGLQRFGAGAGPWVACLILVPSGLALWRLRTVRR